MKAAISTRSLKICAVLWLVFVAGCIGSFAQDLSEIKASIKAKGQKWVAEETSVSVLPENEKKMRVGLMKPHLTGKEKLLSASAPATGLSSAVDLVSYVTPVRNQGSCGSCWAFATTAALESQLLIKNNTPLTDDNRAEQMLVSCSGAGSCSGGYIDSASNYIQATGLPTEPYFPYTTSNNACSNAVTGWQNDVQKVVKWSWVNTSPANLSALKTALATYGPLVTTMDVYADFFNYAGGVYEYSSGAYQGGHAILIVGYTDDPSVNGGGYFKVKNSWGTGWGSGGYFLIAYSQLNSPVYFGEWSIAYSIPDLPAAPAAPSSLVASAAASTQINLGWADGSVNEDGFKIERCSGAGCSSFAQIATVSSNVASYSDKSVAANTTYSYRVNSYNTGGSSSYTPTASATTPAPQPPSAPGSLSAAAASGTQINLKWADLSSNESGFKIERCEGVACSAFSQIATVAAGATSYSSAGLKSNTSYSYRVRAYITGADSAYSNAASATTQCTCSISPTSKSFAAAGGSATVTVTAPAGCAWTPVSNASWLTIQAQSTSSFTYTVAPITGARRTGSITISGQTHSVTQAKK